MPVHVRPMRRDDYDDVVALWRGCAGVVLSSADRPDAIARYLDRNPGLSLVAEETVGVVAALLCGHDGRRGYLHHLAVAPGHRGRGIARCLVERATAGLRQAGIAKCHIFVLRGNPTGLSFWTHLGWAAREDIGLVSLGLETDAVQGPAGRPDGKVE